MDKASGSRYRQRWTACRDFSRALSGKPQIGFPHWRG